MRNTPPAIHHVRREDADRRQECRAFTLVELLVVIGILGILLSILVPTVAKARIAAKQTVCASRLRELVHASSIYLNAYRSYPQRAVLPMQGCALPHFVRTSVLNQLAPNLGIAPIQEDIAVEQLPSVLRCPMREEYDLPSLSRSIPLPDQAVIFSGYQYTACLESKDNVNGQVLKKDRCADARGKHRGVIWSDTLGWYGGSGLVFLPPSMPPGYGYFHCGRQRIDFNGLSVSNVSALAGQHRAFSDGSVEWVDKAFLDLDISRADSNASYRCISGGSVIAYYWF